MRCAKISRQAFRIVCTETRTQKGDFGEVKQSAKDEKELSFNVYDILFNAGMHFQSYQIYYKCTERHLYQLNKKFSL